MNTIPEFFGSLVFDDRVMKSRLPSGVYNSLRKTIAEGASLDSYVAAAVAAAKKIVSREAGFYSFDELMFG